MTARKILWASLFLAASQLASIAQSAAGVLQPVASDQRARAKIAELYKLRSQVTEISYASISPDGLRVAWSTVDPKSGKHRSYLAPLRDVGAVSEVAVNNDSAACDETSPEWSPDSRHIAILSDCATPGQLQIFSVDISESSATAKPVDPRERLRLSSALESRWNKDCISIC